MGDVLLATPLLRQMRRTYPNARLDVIVDERFAEVVRHNPHVDSALEYHRASRSLASPTNTKYDAVIDLQHNRRSAQIRRGLRTKYTSTLDKHRLQKIALVYLKRGLEHHVMPIAERYRQAAQIPNVIEVPDDDDGLELWLPEERAAWKQDNIYPPRLRDGSTPPQAPSFVTIAIAPGAHHATKRWPADRFAAAARQICTALAARSQSRSPSPSITCNVALVGGTADMELCEAVAASLTGMPKLNISNHAGSYSLYETVRVLDRASVLLTNDTGVMHMAAARRVPVVAVFGSTVQQFGFAPFRVRHEVVEAARELVPCRPCTHIGRARCPKLSAKKHFLCMTGIAPERVAEAALRLIGFET